MNTSRHIIILGVLCCVAIAAAGQSLPNSASPPSADNPAPAGAGPRIEFDSMLLNFGKVVAGRVIEHNFIFTNTGNQTLEIKDVRPTCGCTVAGKWDRFVEPGKTSVIPIRYTPTYSDKEVSKTIIVLSNDPSRTNAILQIVGTIWEPIEVSPVLLMFGVVSGSPTNQTRTVRIVNNMPGPLQLSPPECTNSAFQIALKTIRPEKEYELQVAFVPPLVFEKATVPIRIKTSSTNLPVINITAYAVVVPTVMAVPDRLTLPAGPLRSATEITATIQNNGPNPLVLSGAAASISGVDVQLQEVQSGSRFLMTAKFPAGVQLHPGQHVEIQIKTSDAQTPVVTLLVTQGQRLATLLEDSEEAATVPNKTSDPLKP